MDEQLEVVENVTEDAGVSVETKSPTQYRVERERKQERALILKELGIASLEEGKSLIEEHSELVVDKETLTTAVSELTSAKDVAESELSVLKKTAVESAIKSDLISHFEALNAIDSETLVQAIDLEKVTADNMEEVVKAIFEAKPKQFGKVVIAGDPHIDGKPLAPTNAYKEAVESKDYTLANKLFVADVLKTK